MAGMTSARSYRSAGSQLGCCAALSHALPDPARYEVHDLSGGTKTLHQTVKFVSGAYFAFEPAQKSTLTI